MKQCFGLLLALLLFMHSFAATGMEVPPKKAHEILIPVAGGKQISLLTLSQIRIGEFEQQTGQQLKLHQKMTFLLAQRELRKSINPDGSFNNRKMDRFLKRFAGETGFHIGGFALGFFVGLIGVLIAYLIKDDYKRNRVKWAWIGWVTFAVLYLALVLGSL